MLFVKLRCFLYVNAESIKCFLPSRDTQQGCPLSPLLLALTIEPLAILNHMGSYLKGSREDRISLYADDGIWYLSDTSKDLPLVLQMVKSFDSFLDSINWVKSTLLLIGPINFRYLLCMV